MKRKSLITSVLLLIVVLLGACSSTSQNDDENEGEAATKEESEQEEVVEKAEKQDDEEELSELEKLMQEHPYYKELIEKYQTAIKEEWNTEKLADHGLSQEYQDPNSSLPEDYGFELRDINGNGTPELLTGTYIDDHPYVHEIYTLQDDEPVREFVDGIRTSVTIYEDGTIIESYGDMSTKAFKLNDKGAPELQEGYEVSAEGYKGVTGDKESLTEEEANGMMEKYWNEIGSVEHDFMPFLEEEDEDGTNETNETAGDLSEAEMESIMEENYSQLEEVLLEAHQIDELYNQHHNIDEAEQIWKKGIEHNSPFYNDMHDHLFPKVNELVSEEGMESFINAMFSQYWQPVSTNSFFGPESELEVLDQAEDRFQLKQTKIIPPQEAGGNLYEYIYDVSFVKEDDKWKLAEIEEKVWDREMKD